MLRPLARAAALAALTALPSFAHQVFPSSITLRPGGTDHIYVVDLGGCPATITCKSTSPGLVKVALVNMTTGAVGAFGTQVTVGGAVDQLFMVRAEPDLSVAANAVVEICWTGSTSPNPPCSDNNCSPYAPHPVSISITTDPLTLAASAFAGLIGDPISTDDGEKSLLEPPDFDLGGPMRLAFERYYASRLVSDGNASSALGPNWMSNWDWSLEVLGTSVEVTTWTGRVLRFERGGFETDWTLAVYEDEPFQLADSGVNKVLLDPETGHVRTFDASGKLTKVEDGHGNTHTVSYTGSTRTGVSDGLGRSLSFGYTSGKLTSVGDGTRTVSFGYTGSLLTSATDAGGETTSYAYDPSALASARMTSRTRPEGNTPYSHAFNASGRAISETDAASHATTLAYDDATGETTVTDALGNAQVHDHADGKLTRWEDEAGTAATMSYDSAGRRKSITDRLGRTTSWTYHAASGKLASVTEADGSVTSFGYTPRAVQGLQLFDLTSVDLPGTASESYSYDASGNLTSATDRDGATTSFTYNARGQLLTATDPEGGVVTLTYNADSTLATSKDAANETTSYDYDALRRLDLVTRPDGSTVAFTYDALDRVLSITDEDSRTTSFAYDGNGNLLTVTDPSSRVWTFAYDAQDRLESVLDPELRKASATFDARGKLATLTNGAGETTSFGYDPRGRLATISDAAANVWLLGSNAEGIASSSAGPDGNIWSFSSDSRGRVTRATTPLGRSISCSYDAFSRVTRVVDPAGRATKFDYDGEGRLLSVTLPAGGAATATRDGNGGVTAITYPGGSTWTYGRDAAGRIDAVSDPLGRTTSASYDSRSRASSITLPGGLGTGTLTWTDAGLLTDVALSDGTNLSYTYDANGRMLSAGSASFGWDDSGAMTDSNGIAIGRDAARRIESVTLAPGKTVTYTYDARGLLATVSDWVGGTTTFTYDDAARLVAVARPNGLTTRYEYDADSRVTKIREMEVSLLLEVERASTAITHLSTDQIQRLDVTPISSLLPQLGSVARTFDAAGQDTSATYDPRGNLLVDGTAINTFDLVGRLTSHANGLPAVNVAYDDLGFPVQLSGGASAQFGRNYAAGGVSVILRDGAGVDATYVVTTPAGGVLHLVDANTNQRSYFHYDPTFSTRFLSDESGTFTDEYGFDPFGKSLGHIGSNTQPFTFQGHFGVQQLPGTTMHFLGSRWYDAANGRFLTPSRPRPLDTRFFNPYAPTGFFAPLSAAPSNTIAPLPRFADVSTTQNLAALNVCRTNLLFPFVTNQTGFDTGLAIAPTSGSGFGLGAAPTPQAPLSTFGGSPTLQAFTLGRNGFDTAHGFAFISDLGARRLAEGYLALVMDDPPSKSPSPTVIQNGPTPNQCEVIAKFRKRYPPGRRVGPPTWMDRWNASAYSVSRRTSDWPPNSGGDSPALFDIRLNSWSPDTPLDNSFLSVIERMRRQGAWSHPNPAPFEFISGGDSSRKSIQRHVFESLTP